jgi:eukaryotic-like serine/threonine-protein kinase
MHCELCLSEHEEDSLCSNVSLVKESPPTSAGQSNSQPAASNKTLANLVGQTLGRYRLVRLLGSGGMGSVYLAEQTLIQARVALKVLHPHLSQDEGLLARFYAEARAVNLIGHPNLVRIFDISEAPGGIHYFVMEYLEGRPLSQFAPPMNPEFLTRLLIQACDALEAAHRAGVVHRDLKPDNLFVLQPESRTPVLKVLDFGVAKAAGPHLSTQTAVGMVIGTPAYMAPEQWLGKPVDGRADVYALGVTGYRMATGRHPFDRGQLMELLLSQSSERPEPPHVLNPHLPKALSEALLRAMAWQPMDRFASASAFKQALEGTSLALPTPKQAPSEQEFDLRGSTPVISMTLLDRPRRREAVPSEPRPSPGWVARVHRRNREGAVEVRCTDLSRGGIFMCCAEPFPRLFTRLEFSLLLGDEEVECVGEVVRHVDAAHARAWEMHRGVGLQFINPSPRLRELLQQMVPPRPASSRI